MGHCLESLDRRFHEQRGVSVSMQCSIHAMAYKVKCAQRVNITPVKAAHELGGFTGVRELTLNMGKQKVITAKHIHLGNKSFLESCNVTVL